MNLIPQLFALPPSHGVTYYNPGWVEVRGKSFLVPRRVVGEKSDITVFEIDGFTPINQRDLELDAPEGCQLEDPRAIYKNGMIYLSYTMCYRVRGQARKWCHVRVSKLDSDWKLVKNYDPECGFNAKDWQRNNGCEKNWLWFFHNEELQMIYRANPHTVCEFDLEFDRKGTCSTRCDLGWESGEIHGGTPPVLKEDYYWTFFHSSIPKTHPRTYFMGAYAFMSKPPFSITRITPKPLLTGSRDYPNQSPGKSLVIFPCGSALRDGEWLVTLGVNDLQCNWTMINHEELIAETRTT